MNTINVNKSFYNINVSESLCKENDIQIKRMALHFYRGMTTESGTIKFPIMLKSKDGKILEREKKIYQREESFISLTHSELFDFRDSILKEFSKFRMNIDYMVISKNNKTYYIEKIDGKPIVTLMNKNGKTCNNKTDRVTDLKPKESACIIDELSSIMNEPCKLKWQPPKKQRTTCLSK